MRSRGEAVGGGETVEVETAEPESSRPKGKSKRGMKIPKALAKLGKLGKEKGKVKAVEAAPLPGWHYTGSVNTIAPDGPSGRTFLSSGISGRRARFDRYQRRSVNPRAT